MAESPERALSEDEEYEAEPDDPKDPDHPPGMGKQKGRKTFSSDASAGLLQAMDHVLLLSVFLKGATPQSMAAEQEKRKKEKELRSQVHGSEKVRQWLNSDAGEQ